MSTIEDQVKQQVIDKGTISSGDLAEFSMKASKAADAKEPIGEEMNKSSKAEVPKEAYADPMMNLGASDSAADEISDMDPGTVRTDGYAFGEVPLEHIEISAEAKDNFLEALLHDKRYTEKFELFGGKVTGVFRSRRTDESRAILKELHRVWLAEGALPESEYSTMMRHALLRCQLAELNGVEYAPMEAPLSATIEHVEGSNDPKIIPPKWYREMDQFLGGKPEGLVTAIYAELQNFEKRYWTMTKNASDQNFWRPGDST